MIETRRTWLLQGLVPLLGFALFTAALDVFAGNQLQEHDAATIAAISFTLATVFFLGGAIIHQGPATTLRPLRTCRNDVIMINVTTAVTWLSMLFALKFLEPAVVNVVGLALGPLLTVLVSPKLRPGMAVLRAEIMVSLGIALMIGLLVWGSFTGRSGVGELSAAETMAGVGLTLLCGLGSVANVIYSKRLSDARLTPQSILAVRFFLMLAVTWTIVAATAEPGLGAAFLPSALIAVVGVGLPLYLLQVGIKHTEPITASIVLTLSPFFAFALQLPDQRLTPSALTLAGVVGIVIMVAVGMVARTRHDSRSAFANPTHSDEPRTIAMKCAIVDAYGIGRLLPASLRHYGVEPIHVRSQSPDVHLEYQPEDFSVDIQHEGDIEATAARLRKEHVDFVVAAMESGVLLADALSSALGTPGNGMTRPAARRDKHEMVQAVGDAGLLVAESFASASADEIVAWAEAQGKWPVVLKPLASAGMDNVHFCHSEGEIRAGHASILAANDRYGQRNEAALAQEYLAGDEYFVNTVSRDGIHHVVEIWLYHKHQIDSTRAMVSYEHPVASDDPAARQIGAYARGVLDALEIRNGAAHTEIMLTANGPVLVECGARLGGAHVPEIVSRCIGTNQVDLLALVIARPEEITAGRLPAYQLLNHVRFLSLIVPREGVIPPEEGWAAVKALDAFLELIVTQPAGRRIERTVDLASSPGYVYLSADDPACIEADYARLRELERIGLYDRPTRPTAEAGAVTTYNGW